MLLGCPGRRWNIRGTPAWRLPHQKSILSPLARGFCRRCGGVATTLGPCVEGEFSDGRGRVEGETCVAGERLTGATATVAETELVTQLGEPLHGGDERAECSLRSLAALGAVGPDSALSCSAFAVSL